MTTHDDAARGMIAVFGEVGESPLAASDPEFIEFYTDFAFGELLTHVSLSRPDRLLFQLAATISMGALTEYRAMLGGALNVGVTPVQVKELTYQAVAYVGVARVIDFVFATNEVFEARGIALPVEQQSTTTADTRMASGLETQKSIVGGDRVDGMYESAPADALRFQEFLSGNCFGDYYTRGGLDIPMRELVTFALLVALGGADGQVAAHVAANLNVGNTRGQLLDVLTVMLPYVGYPRTLNGLAAVNSGAPAA